MKYNSKTIKLETESVKKIVGGNIVFDKGATDLEARALAILMGEYNKYGRGVDIDIVNKATKKMDEAVSMVEKEL